MCSKWLSGRTGPRRVGACPLRGGSVYCLQQADGGTVPSSSGKVVMEWNTVFLVALAVAVLVGLFS